ncbi:MarR family winged helix-turn-helix transcriptional regulator [Streptococcus caballi]|uniref:MarR family winged helix-turn-helix transcriptional regulator n=1 Tax=Streptococcus caballi TaxID=439220 RepID=UPI000369F2E0|nr:MarR family winged helix-turn-helix transcriptional regulator [Streptococcus caballi]
MYRKDPFSQFRDFINLIENRVHALAESYDIEKLAGPQGRVVMYLRDNSDKEIYIKDIEKRLKISKSVASNLIKRMEKNGFIQVVPSKEDKRYKQVVLTELGKTKTQNIQDFHDEMHKQILAGVNREDLEASFRVFARISKNLEKKE